MDINDFDDLAFRRINFIVALVILILGLSWILASSTLRGRIPFRANHSLENFVASVRSVNKLTSLHLFLLVLFNDRTTHYRGLIRT